ncbi:hypothetical protein AVEN_216443-1 [Araneus ventricosus]|uniref:Uncharacterized protein n=1 Tax=Araneus ventricosus TaxID=182803 RepID=A0A4Y2BPG4_ARAVE|nr:hypothetical protein AVEN_216443-1 [Araneus ventricosus]
MDLIQHTDLSPELQELRSEFLQRFPCDVTPYQEHYKFEAVGIDGDVFGVRTSLKNHFGVSSAVRAGELSAIESAVNVIFSELLSVCVARRGRALTVIASDLLSVCVIVPVACALCFPEYS